MAAGVVLPPAPLRYVAVEQGTARRGKLLHESVPLTAKRRRLNDSRRRHGQRPIGEIDGAGDKHRVAGGRNRTGIHGPAAAEGHKDWAAEAGAELRHKRVGRRARCGRERRAAGRRQRAGCGRPRDVDIARRVQRHRQANVALRADLRLIQNVGRGRVRLDQAHPVLLVDQQVEVARCANLHRVDLALWLALTAERRAKPRECELLRARRWRLRVQREGQSAGQEPRESTLQCAGPPARSIHRQRMHSPPDRRIV